MAQPIQPLVDVNGVERFKRNRIVCHLLENGGIDLNMIATMEFSQEDREQFAQLIGYSWSGACDLPYMSDEVLDAAKLMKDGISEDEARASALRQRLEKVANGMRSGAAILFGVHPDDLGGGA